MRYTVGSFVILAVLWLLLSGHYSALLLGLGAASCAIVVLLARRMAVLDAETQPWYIALPLLGYWCWLFTEIVRANAAVLRLLLAPRLSVAPAMAWVPAHEQTALGQTLFANSITLTPGTVSVRLMQGDIEVHALSEAGVKGLPGGDMDRRTRALDRRFRAQS